MEPSGSRSQPTTVRECPSCCSIRGILSVTVTVFCSVTLLMILCGAAPEPVEKYWRTQFSSGSGPDQQSVAC